MKNLLGTLTDLQKLILINETPVTFDNPTVFQKAGLIKKVFAKKEGCIFNIAQTPLAKELLKWN